MDETAPPRRTRLGLALVGLAFAVVAGLGLTVLVWRPAPVIEVPGPLVQVPSGQPVYYIETVQNIPGLGLTYRFRFVAPEISREGDGFSAETTAADMQVLCNEFAMPRLPATGPIPSQIIISFSDRVVPFGVASPEATQFFEAYRPVNGLCEWELF